MSYLYAHSENVSIPDPGELPVAVFDLDGTLADDSDREVILSQAIHDHGRGNIPSADWEAYFNQCDEDEPIEPTIDLLRILRYRGYYIMILTSRCSSVRSLTEEWLEVHCVPYDALVMRDHKDRREGFLFKDRVVDALGLWGHIEMVFEDRQNVVNMWRNRGVTCYQVAEGNF